MEPKRIGLVGFDGVTALPLTGGCGRFAAATLDNGYGSHIVCYKVFIVGLTSRSFRSESGVVFKPEETIQTAPLLDTIIIPGGSGLRDPVTAAEISNWILKRIKRIRRVASMCTGIYGLGTEPCTERLWRRRNDDSRTRLFFFEPFPPPILHWRVWARAIILPNPLAFSALKG